MWSKRFSECILCGTKEIPHMAKGRCRKCYLSEYAKKPANKRKARAAKDKWYRSNVTPETRRIAREQRHYGGMRQAVLARDEYRCVRCGKSNRLTVHHVDGKGRGFPDPNNDLLNLETLCRSCHAKLHGKVEWSRNYRFCVRCGTTKRKHNARGLCWKCYAASRG